MDMSEYMEKYSVSRLTGPPPGYAGYEEGGQLTEAVRRAPHSVVLLDELEKAHADVLNILLQVMEDGILTDGKGRTVSFKNTVLIMTSNVGSQRILDLVVEESSLSSSSSHDVGDVDEAATTERQRYYRLIQAVKAELEAQMKPEFLNRIDDIIVFQPLTDKELSLIATMMVLGIAARTKAERNVDVAVTERLLDQIVQQGTTAVARQLGARPMRRAVQRILEDSISESVVAGFVEAGDVVTFDTKFVDDESREDTTSGLVVTPLLCVQVQRERDDEVFYVQVEESGRDFVATPAIAAVDAAAAEEDDNILKKVPATHVVAGEDEVAEPNGTIEASMNESGFI